MSMNKNAAKTDMFQTCSFAYGLRLQLKRFSVLFHVFCDGWNKTILTTRNGICFTVLTALFQLCGHHCLPIVSNCIWTDKHQGRQSRICETVGIALNVEPTQNDDFPLTELTKGHDY